MTGRVHDDEGCTLQISETERQALAASGRLQWMAGEERLAGLAFDESVFYLSFRSVAMVALMAGTRSEAYFRSLDQRHREALQHGCVPEGIVAMPAPATGRADGA